MTLWSDVPRGGNILMVSGSEKLRSQSNKNGSTISSSTSNKLTKNITATVNKSTDEEKRNHLSKKNGANLISVKRTLNRDTIQKVDAKPSVSRSRELSFPTTSRTKPFQVFQKRTQPTGNNQAFSRLKDPANAAAVSKTKPLSGKPNLVMNTVHNVTVTSPPSKRKKIPIQTIIETEEQHIRSINRTLDREEILIFKNTTTASEVPLKVKEPIAFEVVFDKSQKPDSDDKFKNSRSQFLSNEADYDDDFESYESDFETGSSSELISESSNSSKSTSINDRESPTNGCETDTEYISEGEEESELTHIPITVIHREKERQLDSGNYDLNFKRCCYKESFDSFETIANSEQLDSGISYENDISFEAKAVTYGGYPRFYSMSKTTKRGAEIMSKIQFDRNSFILLDLKPIPYDIFMRMFGNLYTMQSTTQTLKNCIESESQTNEDEMRSVWTQHPPRFDFASIQGSYGVSQCTGELLNFFNDDEVLHEDIFDNTIQDLSKLRQNTTSSGIEGYQDQPINFERLNTFLNSSSSIISQILTKNAQDLLLDYTDLPNHSKGFFKLNTNLLNALTVVRVFANGKFNLILTVHESIDSVYYTDFSNLIMVWNSENSAKPLRLLSTWSEVTRAEICNDSSEVIVCGLRDGSVAMWDMRETYSFCSKLDGHLTHFAATQSVAPSWGRPDMRSIDSGAVIDVKSFRSTSKIFSCEDKFKNVQFASLCESGLLAIWTLVETSTKNYEITHTSDSKLEYSSPWARVKLIQSATCDLREYIEIKNIRPKSAFENIKSNFQKDVFNDDILKELSESKNNTRLGIQGLRFINLDCGTEFIFVGTNRNFVISCPKTLKKERFRKINIVGSGFLFPTAIKLLQNENFLAVGLSNGSVMILNCNQGKTYKKCQGNVPDSQRRPGTAQSKSDNFDYEIGGKSCAIQNIIRNERLSVVSHFVKGELRPKRADLSATLEEGKPYELQIFDEQILLSGSVSRKDLIQNLEFSNDGLLLFVLSDGNVRIYDFCKETEVSFCGNTKLNRNIINVATSRQGNEINIIFLDNCNNVKIHLLK